MPIGPLELSIVLIVALVILGPKRLPDAGRSLGRGLREFKESVSGGDESDAPRTLAASDAGHSTEDAAVAPSVHATPRG